MNDFKTKTDISDYTDYQQHSNVDAVMLVDERSSTLFYIGVSKNGKDVNKPIWRIRKIRKTGTTWYVTEYPNGSQDFKFVWNSRLSYTYV